MSCAISGNFKRISEQAWLDQIPFETNNFNKSTAVELNVKLLPDSSNFLHQYLWNVLKIFLMSGLPCIFNNKFF